MEGDCVCRPFPRDRSILGPMSFNVRLFILFRFVFFLSSTKRKTARVELISIDQKIINVLKRKSTKVFALDVTFHWPTSLLILCHNLATEACVNLFLRFTSYKYEKEVYIKNIYIY